MAVFPGSTFTPESARGPCVSTESVTFALPATSVSRSTRKKSEMVYALTRRQPSAPTSLEAAGSPLMMSFTPMVVVCVCTREKFAGTW